MTVGDLGEAALIALIRSQVPSAPRWVTTGIGDDAAVVAPMRGTLDVITTDTQVEGVHFERALLSPSDIGHRTLAVNLSDLAAMGATPRVAVLSLVLPPSLATADLEAMIEGLLSLATAHDVALVGGNITRTSGPLVLGVTAIGAVRRRRILTRDGGRPGDELWVTGTLGSAAAGLTWLQQQQAGHAPADQEPRQGIQSYRRPTPRVRIGALLGRNRVARAGIDLSDGLADGLHQLGQASGLGALIHGSAVPMAPETVAWFAHRQQHPLEAAMTGGDDYELLIAVPRSHRRRLAAIQRLSHGVPLTRIGELTKTLDLVVRTETGDLPVPAGYQHFQDTVSSPA